MHCMVVIRYHNPQLPANLASGQDKVVIKYVFKPQPPARLASGHCTLLVRRGPAGSPARWGNEGAR